MSKQTIPPERAEILARATLYLSDARSLWENALNPYLKQLAQVDSDAAGKVRTIGFLGLLCGLEVPLIQLSVAENDNKFTEIEASFIEAGQEFHRKAAHVYSFLQQNLDSHNNRYNGWANVRADLQALGRAITDLGTPTENLSTQLSAQQSAPSPDATAARTKVEKLERDRQRYEADGPGKGRVTMLLLCDLLGGAPRSTVSYRLVALCRGNQIKTTEAENLTASEVQTVLRSFAEKPIRKRLKKQK